MKTLGAVTLSLLLLIGSFLLGRVTAPKPAPVVRTDTVIVRDTIRDTVLIPQKEVYVRTDTVWLKAAGDTVFVEVEVPIERKVYQTDDYKATIEGFRPNLVAMEVYRQTQYITRTEVKDKKYWFEFGVGLGAGYDPFTNKVYPTLQVGFYVPLWRLK